MYTLATLCKNFFPFRLQPIESFVNLGYSKTKLIKDDIECTLWCHGNALAINFLSDIEPLCYTWKILVNCNKRIFKIKSQKWPKTFVNRK